MYNSSTTTIFFVVHFDNCLWYPKQDFISILKNLQEKTTKIALKYFPGELSNSIKQFIVCNKAGTKIFNNTKKTIKQQQDK